MDQCIRLVSKTNNFFIFQNRLNKKKWIEVLDTSGILPSKLQNALICQDNFSENYFTSSQKTRFHRCGVPSPSVVRSKFTVSQNNSFSR
jgi:hypothetical protein